MIRHDAHLTILAIEGIHRPHESIDRVITSQMRRETVFLNCQQNFNRKIIHQTLLNVPEIGGFSPPFSAVLQVLLRNGRFLIR